ncbi:hypothetical protein O0I10_003427 [Lichtheimia ornata]|uniref:SAC3/GANP/THP3 conserved domain-containing protein n=1 Tax=Lichtheimia ornata TaxID=688661 RepID=A0AAD7XXI5_9FUNG|nr:uncharacterized protein O0I10_003427 [Lichtheimia ornata]KAJ8660784.1 hypothetical protein O0I10_003427 [Lichtheimia ornata]
MFFGGRQNDTKNATKNRNPMDRNKSHFGVNRSGGRGGRANSNQYNDHKTALYSQLKEKRVTERANAIKNGLIPDPSKPMRLADAIDFRGTLQHMCSRFEQVEREVQNMLDPLEMDASGQADPKRTVKKYRRSAAGNEQPLPSDVRPPHVLRRTLDYLVNEILMQYPLIKCHGFLWDRTRSIRQDFTLQNIRDASAVELHEKIARLHILSLHELCEYDDEKFSEQQETEQLRKVLLSLMEFYDDLREDGIETPNEAEFRAYYLISHIRDHEVARQIMQLPRHVLFHPLLQRALQFYELIQRNNEIMETSERRNKFTNVEASQNNYSKLFKLVGEGDTPFLLACMMEWHFPDIRKGALKAMNRAYLSVHIGVEVEYLRQVLAYDSVKQLLSEAHLYGLSFEVSATQTTIRFGQKTKQKMHVFVEPLSNPRPTKSMLLVDPKKGNRTFAQIVNGELDDVLVPTKNNLFQTLPNDLPANGGPVINTFRSEHRLLPTVDATKAFANARRVQEGRPSTPPIPPQQQQYQLQVQAQQEALRQQQEKARLEEQKRQEQEQVDTDEVMRSAQVVRAEEQLRMEVRAQLEEQERYLAEKRREYLAKIEEEERNRHMARLRERAVESVREHKRKRREEMVTTLSDFLTTAVLEAVTGEETRKAAKHTMCAMKLIKRRMTPLLKRVRARIQKRQDRVRERNSLYRLTQRLTQAVNTRTTINNTVSSTPQSRSMAIQSLMSEGMALRRAVQKPTKNNPTAIWEMKNVAHDLYPHIKEALSLRRANKDTWLMYIHLEAEDMNATQWFMHKFGLDPEFHRRIERVQDMTIGIRALYPTSPIYSQVVDDTSSIIFGLSEMRHSSEGDDIDDVIYWRKEKQRLDRFCQQLKAENPAFHAPFLFTYWPRTKALQSAIEMLPDFLGLEQNQVVHSYHILIMNPTTIPERLDEELTWLARSTVVNTLTV